MREIEGARHGGKLLNDVAKNKRRLEFEDEVASAAPPVGGNPEHPSNSEK